MDKQIMALKDSIEHWERLANGNSKRGESISGYDCACCQEFDCCHRCPIKEFGFNCCSNDEFNNAYDLFNFYRRPKRSKQFKQAAYDQVSFLKQILAWVEAGKPEK